MTKILVNALTIAWMWINFIDCSYAARILGIFPADARSHFNFHEAAMKSLLTAGHQVTVVAPMRSEFSHINYTIIDCKNRNEDDEHPWAFAPRQKLTSLPFLMAALDVLESECRHILNMERQINVTGNYDVMFVETVPMFQCYFLLAKKAGIPVIGTLSLHSFMGSDMFIGNPRNPLTVPRLSSFVHSKISFHERIVNVVEEVKMKIFYFFESQKLIKISKELFLDPDLFSFSLSLLFVNNHEGFLPRAQMPNTINIGGIQMKMAQLQILPESLKIFIENAEKGVILFSLGSITTNDSLEPEVKDAFVKAFAKIPQRVIWKFDEQIDGLSENVWLSGWLPQKEILAHENVKAFISHGGISSFYEAINFGKPLILIPLFADQPGNAGILTSLGVGKNLDSSKLTESNLLEALNEVVNNTKYTENMKKLSKVFRDEQLSPSEKVVFWTEYVLKHNGTAHLRSVAVDMPIYQYLLLDIIVFFITGFILTGYIIYFLIKFIIKMVFC